MSRQLKYEIGERITILWDGKESNVEVIDLDVDDPREPYYVEFLEGPNEDECRWVEAGDVVGGAFKENRFKVGDEFIINDQYTSSWNDVLVGQRARVIQVDESDTRLPYKVKLVQPLKPEIEAHGQFKDLISEHVIDHRNEQSYGGLWFRDNYMDEVAPAEPDLPSFNPGATISESVGMWRPPQVNS